MDNTPVRAPADAFDTDTLLDLFIAQRRCRPPRARVISDRRELSWLFEGYARRRGPDEVWRAWVHQGRMSFVLGERCDNWSQRLGRPALRVCFFDVDALPVDVSVWWLREDGKWQACEP